MTLNLIPITKTSKKPPKGFEWKNGPKNYQLEQSTEEERNGWKMEGYRYGVVCGQVSGNLEIIDFDWESDTYFPQWKSRLRDDYGIDFDSLGCPVVKTVKGYHIYYRCKVISAATALASRSTDGKVLIETRGEGSYVVSSIDDSTGQYVLVAGDLEAVPIVDADTRDAMLSCGRSFNQTAPQTVYVSKELPGEDYNEKATWEDILKDDGWNLFRTRADGVTEWTRPGKVEGISATVGIHDSDILYVFTSSMPPLEGGRGYTKFGYLTVFHYNGDASACASALAAQGYGQRVDAKDSQWSIMASIVEAAEVVQDIRGLGYVVTPTGVVPVQSDGAKKFFLEKFKEESGSPPTKLLYLQQAVDYAAVLAMGGETVELEPRIHHEKDVTWVDLCQPKNRTYMRVGPNGITKVEAPAKVYLSRNTNQLPMDFPDFENAEIESLRQFLNVENETSWDLVKIWLLSTVCPYGSKPILLLHGNAGSGKTTFTRILKQIVDPCDTAILTYPKGQEDLRIHASTHAVIPYDNLSGITNSLSDALSTLATGVGYQVRKLYTDDEVYHIKAKRSIILNGIDPTARRGDFASRAIHVELSTSFDKRLTEKEIDDGVAQNINKWRGWLWRMAVVGRREFDNVDLSNNLSYRLSDMTRFLLALENTVPTKLGLTHTVAELLASNKEELDGTLVESDSVALMFAEYMKDKQEVTGTATEIFDAVYEWGGRKLDRIKDWPDSPIGFGIRLSRATDHLLSEGLVVERKSTHGRSIYHAVNTRLTGKQHTS